MHFKEGNTMINIKKDMAALQSQIEQFKTNYQASIQGTIKQNPDIAVLSKKPRCFILPFNKLSGESWSPEYYDFELQVDILIAAIKQLSIERISNYFEHIIKSGSLPYTKITDEIK